MGAAPSAGSSGRAVMSAMGHKRTQSAMGGKRTFAAAVSAGFD